MTCKFAPSASIISPSSLRRIRIIPERGDAILNLKLSPLKNAAQETQGVAVVLDDLTEQREREETLELMTRYLPPGMVDNIQQIAGLALGGERREMTSMFVYVCPYTLSASTPARSR